MKERMHSAETLSVFLTVVCLCLCLLLPRPIGEHLALAAAYAVWPEGGVRALRTRENRTQPVGTTAPSADEVPASLPLTLTQTPQDILELMDAARKRAVQEQKDGEIRQQTFGKASATDSCRGLWIRNVTEDVHPDFAQMMDAPLPLQIDRQKPAVLIYHTHTTEGFELLDRDWYAADVTTRTEDTARNIARVGSAIAEELERAGFIVLHDKTVHDRRYTGAYDRSRETVQSYLDQYPELVVTLDVHRDAIEQNNGVRIKPVTEIGGRKAAQIMLIAGAEGGKVENFGNWTQNLGFALRLQQACETAAPTLMRPIFFCHRKYNMDMTPCSLLVEIGSSANTLEEAVYAGRLFGRSLAALLAAFAE